MATVSFLIPARNEEFLVKTIQDILEHTSEESEILVGLDGYWPNPPIEDHPRVKIFHVTEPIGQRAMTNKLAALSKARYLCKVDAHCAFDQDFDKKMIEFFNEVGHDIVAVPVMRNLHAFDWVCPDGHKRYQGPSGACKECGKETTKEIKWIGKTNPQSFSYCFDSEPHFQYYKEYTRRPEFKKELGYNETMSLQGSFFMSTRHNYWKLNLGDENFGSWGSQGIQVAVSTWLSGRRVLVNHKTWYAHLFRTQGGDFGFPYRLSDKQVQRAKQYAKKMLYENKWPKQIYPSSWLLEKFWPVPGWTQEQLNDLKLIGSKFVSSAVPVSSPDGITGLTHSTVLAEVSGRE